jgi:hypothetical protein
VKKEYTSYTYGEAKTGIGQHVQFTCASEDVEKVKSLIEGNIRDIEVPITRASSIGHGGYGRYSRYKMKQHKYAGGQNEAGGGFIEVLEILNPPEGRHSFVVHEYDTHHGSCFSEWDSVELAVKAFGKSYRSEDWRENIKTLPGFKRIVECGPLQPWFYAVGEEELWGDYALASGLEEDPFFRLGRKFVVSGEDGVSSVKTCLGSRFVTQHSRDDWSSTQTTQVWRYVYFDDGTTFRIDRDSKVDGYSLHGDRNPFPRPLRDDEVWVTHAMEQFQALLSGMKEGFQIKFADGRVFTAKLSKNGKAPPSVEGDYLVEVTGIDHHKRKGWVNNFVPSGEHANIVSFVRAKYAGPVEIAKIKIIECRPKKGGKKWSGAFFIPKSV